MSLRFAEARRGCQHLYSRCSVSRDNKKRAASPPSQPASPLSKLSEKLLAVEPVASHVTPQGEPTPFFEARVIASDLLVSGLASVISYRKKSCARPGIERQPIITAKKFEKVFGGIRPDAFYTSHLFHQIASVQRALEPPFDVKLRLKRRDRPVPLNTPNDIRPALR